MIDRITITGIAAHGHHGVLPRERRDGQRFLVDVVMEVDLARAAATDDLADTIDYSWVAQGVSDVVTGEPCDLIETLAARCLDVAMEDPRVQAATVTVHKPDAPHTVEVASTAVTVRRTREGGQDRRG